MQPMDTNKAHGRPTAPPSPERAAGRGGKRARAVGPAVAALRRRRAPRRLRRRAAGRRAASAPAGHQDPAASTPAGRRLGERRRGTQTAAADRRSHRRRRRPPRNCTSTGASVTADRAPGRLGGRRGHPIAAGHPVRRRQPWRVAGNGRILATSDGGHSWTRQYAGPAALYQVDFTDAAHGWAVARTRCCAPPTAEPPGRRRAEPCARRVPGLARHARASTRSTSYRRVWVRRGRRRAGAGAPVLGSLSGPFSGSSLLRTADGGQTWQRLGVPRPTRSRPASPARRAATWALPA